MVFILNSCNCNGEFSFKQGFERFCVFCVVVVLWLLGWSRCCVSCECVGLLIVRQKKEIKKITFFVGKEINIIHVLIYLNKVRLVCDNYVVL